MGIDVKNALEIGPLLDSISKDKIAVVFFDLDHGIGHFSPLIGIQR